GKRAAVEVSLPGPAEDRAAGDVRAGVLPGAGEGDRAGGDCAGRRQAFVLRAGSDLDRPAELPDSAAADGSARAGGGDHAKAAAVRDRVQRGKDSAADAADVDAAH